MIRLRLIKPRLIGVSPAGVEYVARYMGDAAILRARLDAAWARHDEHERERLRGLCGMHGTREQRGPMAVNGLCANPKGHAGCCSTAEQGAR